ncbi:MAG: RDD family protein [Gallionellaceae bacterium]
MSINSRPSDLGVEYAGFWVRFAAYLLDVAIILFLTLAITLGATFVGEAGVMIAGVATLLINLLYFPVMESSQRQATFGKSLCGIKVTDLDGKQLTFLRSLLRNIAKILSAIPFCIGFLLAAFTGRKQALHDMLANCLVVRTTPSQLLKVLLMAVLGIALTLGSGAAYFYYVYLPQMGNPFTGMMQDASNSIPAAHQPTKVIPAHSELKPANTDAKFDSLIGPTLSGFDDIGMTKVGQAILELSKIIGDSVWVYVHLPLSKGDTQAIAEVTVTSVVDRSGKNYYDSDSNLEQGSFYLSPHLNTKSSPIHHLAGIRTVHITPGLSDQTLQKIEGKIRISFPLELQPVSFEAGEESQEKTAAGAAITLKSFTAKKVTLHYQGDSSKLLAVRGFDKNGGSVKTQSTATMTLNDKSMEKQIFFSASVSRVEVPVANIISKVFPFTLVKDQKSGAASSAKKSTAAKKNSNLLKQKKYQAKLASHNNTKTTPLRANGKSSKPAMQANKDASSSKVLAASEPQPIIITPKFNDVFTAVMYQDQAAIKELLDLGWWVDKPEPGGETPLMKAVNINDLAIVELLLQHAADPNVNVNGISVLTAAKRNHNAAMIGLLQRYGATLE